MLETSGGTMTAGLPLVTGGETNGALFAQDTVKIQHESASGKPDWQNVIIAGLESARTEEVKQFAQEQADLALRFGNRMRTLIGDAAVLAATYGGPYSQSQLTTDFTATSILTMTVDGVTFGYRAKFDDSSMQRYLVFAIEYAVDDEERYTEDDPNAPRRELWFGPLEIGEDVGRYLMREISAYSPRNSPQERPPIALLNGTVPAAVEQLWRGNYERASADALISIARGLENLVAILEQK